MNDANTSLRIHGGHSDFINGDSNNLDRDDLNSSSFSKENSNITNNS
jgi:hypothetical protein